MSLEIEITSPEPGNVVMGYPFRKFLLDWVSGTNVWEITFLWRGFLKLPGLRLRLGSIRLHIMYKNMADRGKARGFSTGYIDKKFHFWVLHPL